MFHLAHDHQNFAYIARIVIMGIVPVLEGAMIFGESLLNAKCADCAKERFVSDKLNGILVSLS